MLSRNHCKIDSQQSSAVKKNNDNLALEISKEFKTSRAFFRKVYNLFILINLTSHASCFATMSAEVLFRFVINNCYLSALFNVFIAISFMGKNK